MIAVAGLLAACSENSIAPASQAPEEEPTAFDYGGGATADLSPYDTLKFSITIDPSRQTYFDLGSGNSITFPVGSLCNPTKSTYGVGEWDKPCTRATSPVTVAVTAWLDGHGHPRVDFTPNVRFVPTWDPRQWVRITFSDLQASLDLSFAILYCPSAHSQCKDEAKSDITLMTYRDPITHKLTRRIKHFSGYNVAAGDQGLDGDDSRQSSFSSSLTMDTPFRAVADRSVLVTPLMRRVRVPQTLSGYILASG
jgi:hypothetical protein